MSIPQDHFVAEDIFGPEKVIAVQGTHDEVLKNLEAYHLCGDKIDISIEMQYDASTLHIVCKLVADPPLPIFGDKHSTIKEGVIYTNNITIATLPSGLRHDLLEVLSKAHKRLMQIINENNAYQEISKIAWSATLTSETSELHGD